MRGLSPIAAALSKQIERYWPSVVMPAARPASPKIHAEASPQPPAHLAAEALAKAASPEDNADNAALQVICFAAQELSSACAKIIRFVGS